MSPPLSLILAVAALALWYTLVAVVGVQAGAVHLLIAVGVVLAIRWWALRQSRS